MNKEFAVRSLTDLMFVVAFFVAPVPSLYFIAWNFTEAGNRRATWQATQFKRYFFLALGQTFCLIGLAVLLMKANGDLVAIGASMDRWMEIAPTGWCVNIIMIFMILSPLLTIATLVHIKLMPATFRRTLGYRRYQTLDRTEIYFPL